MTVFNKFSEGEFIIPGRNRNGFSLRLKLLCGLIPSAIIILIITGYFTYLTSSHFLNQALERSTRLQAKAMSHEIETVFTRCKQNLQLIAQTAGDDENLRKIFAGLVRTTGLDYREMGFIAQKEENCTFWIAKNATVQQIPADEIADIHPDPLLYLEHLTALKPDQVWMSPVVEVDHPFQAPENPNQRIRSHVIYFGTPCFSDNGERRGYLLLSLDIRSIRNILSLYNSSRSPILAFTRTPEIRYAYLFDPDGWILFQSEGIEKKDLELTTDLARSNYTSGILGKPGLASAFRPDFDFTDFWTMVEDVRKGNQDLIVMENASADGSLTKAAYLAYAPVFFEGNVIAGLAYIDRTQFTRTAGYKHLDIMLFISILTIAAVSMVIFILAHMITKPIYQLVGAVNHIQEREHLSPIHIPSTGYEVNLLVNAINNLINTLIDQLDEIKEKEIKLQTVEFKEKIQLETEFPKPARPGNGPSGNHWLRRQDRTAEIRHPQSGGQRRRCSHHRRNRHRQAAGGRGDPPARPSIRPPLHIHQLRRAWRNPSAGQPVRSHQRGIHRSENRSQRRFFGGPWGHPFFG